MRLLYVMDPMCGWCYGFQPEFEALIAHYPNVEVEWIMGGLAPDSMEPMPAPMREAIASYWHQIEARSQVRFNHSFWNKNTPYRSTYPACRAVIAAEAICSDSAQAMVKAIQSAYYLEAQNPSLVMTLEDCADRIGLDREAFRQALDSELIEQCLQQQLSMAHRLKVTGFPTLFYVNASQQAYRLVQGFCETEEMVRRLEDLKLQGPAA